MKPPFIQMSVTTLVDTKPWSLGKQLLGDLCHASPLLEPEFVASFSEEQFKEKLLFSDVGQTEKNWTNTGCMKTSDFEFEFPCDFLWRRRKTVHYDGVVNHTQMNLKGELIPGRVHMMSVWNHKIRWMKLFEDWCQLTQAQSGLLHLFTEPEMFQIPRIDVTNATEKQEKYKEGWDSFRCGLFSRTYTSGDMNTKKTGITNIGWAMFYGDKFKSDVNFTAIATAGFPIKRVANGYLVQVTDSIHDVANDFTAYSKKRAQLKALFQQDLFLIQDEPNF